MCFLLRVGGIGMVVVGSLSTCELHLLAFMVTFPRFLSDSSSLVSRIMLEEIFPLNFVVCKHILF